MAVFRVFAYPYYHAAHGLHAPLKVRKCADTQRFTHKTSTKMCVLCVFSLLLYACVGAKVVCH